MLTLVKDLGMKFPTETSPRKRRYGLYLCRNCGNTFESRTDSVNSGQTVNCSNCNNTTHGLSNHPLYNTWVHEKKRCYSPATTSYNDYGGRGITVSKEFHNFIVWLEYVESLENANVPTYSIDRINNNGNYERGNLRWASKAVQSQNTRKNKNNTSGYRGVRKSLNRWRANIESNGIKTNLGVYNTRIEAAAAYDVYVITNNTEHQLNNVLISANIEYATLVGDNLKAAIYNVKASPFTVIWEDGTRMSGRGISVFCEKYNLSLKVIKKWANNGKIPPLLHKTSQTAKTQNCVGLEVIIK